MQKYDISIILNEYKTLIHSYFNKKIFNKDDVEDLIQEAMCAIISSYPNYRRQSKISTWIYGICNNIFFNYLRKNKKMKNNEVINDTHSHPRININKITIKLLIERLPKNYKTLYNLYYEKNYKIIEISKLLCIPMGTIKYQLHDLRNKIDLLLKK